MDDRSGTPAGEPRQRWRIVFARENDALSLTASDAVACWEAALLGSGLPIAMSQGRLPRPRLVFAAPLPAGIPADAELADLVLTQRLTRAALRDRLARCLPAGYRLVELYDVWLGEPALTARLAAADYRVTVRAGLPDAPSGGATLGDRSRAVCDELLAARALQRARPKGDSRTVAYDLRPLIVELAVADGDREIPAGCLVLRMRLRLGGESASGRPDEVVRALGERLGIELTIERMVRERLLTSDELAAQAAPGRVPATTG